jgi:hypothetical protein
MVLSVNISLNKLVGYTFFVNFYIYIYIYIYIYKLNLEIKIHKIKN